MDRTPPVCHPEAVRQGGLRVHPESVRPPGSRERPEAVRHPASRDRWTRLPEAERSRGC